MNKENKSKETKDRAAFLKSLKDSGQCCGGEGGDECECNKE